jgi:hypothetical protein
VVYRWCTRPRELKENEPRLAACGVSVLRRTVRMYTKPNTLAQAVKEFVDKLKQFQDRARLKDPLRASAHVFTA